MGYNADFLISGFLIYAIAIYCVLVKKGVRNTKNRIYIAFLVTGALACFCDLVGIWLLNHFPQDLLGLKLVFYGGYHLFHPMTGLFFVLFILDITGTIHLVNLKKFLVLVAPLLLFYIPLFLNAQYRTVFYFDASGTYLRGPWMALEYVCGVFYMLVAVSVILRFRKALDRTEVFTLLFFIVITICGVVTQFLNNSISVEVFVMALGSIALLFTVENQDALYDPVTGLLNRNALLEELSASISSGIRFQCIALYFQNYDDVATKLGYRTIDSMEAGIAEYLRSFGRDLEYFYCEDGFCCMLLYHPRTARVEEIEQKLQEKFASPWVQDGYAIPFLTTIASYRIPEAADSMDQIYALFARRKIHQDDMVRILHEADLEAYHREIAVAKAIEKALRHNRFQVYYQPIWDSEKNCIRSAEALLRLYDEEMGWIVPDEFIRVAESNGAIYDLGEYVFEAVCRDIGWRDFESMGIDYVEVNLSPLQCMRSNLVDRFKEIMEEYHVRPEQINLEITETATAGSLEMLRSTMEDFQKMGIRFSLDDFGTGVSNMESLVELDFEIVKIDKSILWNTKDYTAKDTFLENTIHLLKGSDFKIVVEGVETQEQKEFLRSHQCDFCQGFYFHKPASVFDFIGYVKKFNHREDQDGSEGNSTVTV